MWRIGSVLVGLGWVGFGLDWFGLNRLETHLERGHSVVRDLVQRKTKKASEGERRSIRRRDNEQIQEQEQEQMQEQKQGMV